MEGKNGRGISDAANRTGSMTTLEHSTWIRCTRRNSFDSVLKSPNFLQSTEEGPIESQSGILGDHNDSWENTMEANGRENYELPENAA